MVIFNGIELIGFGLIALLIIIIIGINVYNKIKKWWNKN